MFWGPPRSEYQPSNKILALPAPETKLGKIKKGLSKAWSKVKPAGRVIKKGAVIAGKAAKIAAPIVGKAIGGLWQLTKGAHGLFSAAAVSGKKIKEYKEQLISISIMFKILPVILTV